MACKTELVMPRVSYFKNVWQTLTTHDGTVNAKNVRNVLTIVKTQLIKGILIYEPYSEQSFTEWGQKYNFKDPTLERIVHKLSIALNLHACEAWNIFCNYLIFEYYGKITDIKKISQYDEYVKTFIENVWHFYTSERMYIMKSVRYILENFNNKSNHFQHIYGKYVEVLVPDIRNYLLKQMNYLIKEITYTNHTNCVSIKEWIDRNNREQIEVILSLIVTMEHSKIEMTQYLQLLNIFKEHNFTKQPCYFESTTISAIDDRSNIRNAEIGACLVGLENCWADNATWLNFSESIENVILRLASEGDHAILLLTWATLQMTLPTETAKVLYVKKYHKYTSSAIQQLVFSQMYELISSDIFKTCHAGKLIKKSVYTILEHVCDKFDTNGEIFNCHSSCLLLSELIKEPDLASKCLASDLEGASTLYTTALRLFPSSFHNMTLLYTTLIACESTCSKVLKCLSKMPFYTEEYLLDNQKQTETLILQYNYPATGSDLIFPAGTPATIWYCINQSYITVRANCSYFTVLRNLVNNSVVAEEFTEKNLKSIRLGYNLLLEVLKIPDAQNIREVQQCVQILPSLMLKFMRNPFRCADMIQTTFKVCIALTKAGDQTMLTSLLLHNFLPTYAIQQYHFEDFFRKESINVGEIFEFIREEKSSYVYTILNLYLDLIETCIEKGCLLQKVQVPGVIFMTLHVFAKHIDWPYSRTIHQKTITMKCFQIYVLVLQRDLDTIEFEIERYIYKFCRDSFLNNDLIIRPFLMNLRLSNTYLNLQMHGEPDWESGHTLEVFQNVRLSLSIFLVLLSYESVYEETLMKRVFPNETERKNFLKIIAGYMQQTFDQTVAKLGIKVLTKIALESGIPMLSTLDMDYYQLQGLFLYRLRDPLVNDNVKIAIVDLIRTCVCSQHGMTAGFFNITCEQKSTWEKKVEEDKSGESVTEFLVEYLANIKQSSDYLHSPLQAAILDLFHTIWISRKDMLIAELTRMDTFWTTLAEPLIKTSHLSNKTYIQILNIMTLEVVKEKGQTNTELQSMIKKMFANNSVFTDMWTCHLLRVFDKTNQKHDDAARKNVVVLLKVWKNFIMIVTKVFSSIFEESDVRFCLANASLCSLTQHIKNEESSEVIEIWAELYLYLISTWPETCRSLMDKAFTKIVIVMRYFLHFYDNFEKEAKEALLGVAVKTVQNASDYLDAHKKELNDFLEPLGDIIDAEHKLLYSDERIAMRKSCRKSDMAWTLIMALISSLLKINSIAKHVSWFEFYQILPKIQGSLHLFTEEPKSLHVAKAVIQCLTNYAKSPITKNYLNVDIDQFYDSVKPSGKYINLSQITNNNEDISHYEEWWKLYRGIIEINTILLQRFGILMVDHSFAFISLHLDVVKQTLQLPRVTAELSALKLVCSVLNFCVHLLRWKQYWHLDNNVCFRQVMDGVKDSFNACISILLRPKIICFFSIGNESALAATEDVPNQYMIDIMDLIIDIIAMCCKCFVKASIHLTQYFKYFDEAYSVSMVEIDFHVPKMMNDRPETLTFGSLLCTLHFLCKSISQVNFSHVALPPVERVDARNTQTMPYMVFVCSDYIQGYNSSDKFNTIQHFAASELSGMSAPWLSRLNEKKITYALETLTTLLAKEIYTTLQTNFVEPGAVQYIRRELCSELQTFHEYIRKRAHEIQQHKAMVEIRGAGDAVWRAKTHLELNIDDYLLALSQWFIHICDLSH